jgi:hypothetical protein
MKDIHEAIKEKRDTIRRIQAELGVLEEAAALLNGGSVSHEVRVHTAVLATAGARARVERNRAVHPMKGKVNPKSSVGQAVIALRESSVPLHIGEILARIKKRGVVDAKKTSLFSTVLKLSKQGRIFYKAEAPGTFGLMEWRQTKAIPAS